MSEYLMPSFLILIGFVGLVAGGEFLVRGAAAIAAAARISPLVIGLTVVAFGTSAPELAVNLQSAYVGATALAVGNAVGSNVFNVLVVVGLTALVTPPLLVSPRIVRFDVPLMIGASLLLFGLAYDGGLSRMDGILMFSLLVIYLVWCVVASRKENEDSPVEEYKSRQLAIEIVFLIGGLVLLALGADWLVTGGSAVAKLWGISELMIGLTIVAIGTSLPEVVTSIVASYRGERDIAVGNVVGSNLFNILCVLGLGSICAPNGIPVGNTALTVDIPIMIAIAVVCLPIFYSAGKVTRWEGALLFLFYPIYTIYLVLRETNSPRLGALSMTVQWVLLPLTVIFIALGVAQHLRASARQTSAKTQ